MAPVIQGISGAACAPVALNARAALESDIPRLLIKPNAGWRLINFRELWHYRELLFFFVWRDIKVRYKQTVLGAAWAIIQPLFTMLVFTLFFGKLAQIATAGIPYALFSFAALLPWTYFANGLNASSGSLASSSHLITKVYFPRLLLPASAVVAGLVDYVIAFAVFLVLLFCYGQKPPSAVLIAVPLLTLLTAALALGAGLWLSALTVQYRDLRHVVPFLIQLWLFVSPVVYPLSLIPMHYRWLARLNPMTGIIEGFRSSLFGQRWDLAGLLLSTVFAAALLISGAHVFRRLERTFADVV
jgi:lipopolysaccharide transport system permease protein